MLSWINVARRRFVHHSPLDNNAEGNAMRSGWMMLVVGVALAGCAAQPTTVATPEPIYKTTEEWIQCTQRAYADLQDRGRKEFGDPSAYTGTDGGGGLQSAMSVCGYRPEEAMTADQEQIIRNYCKYSPSFSPDDLSNADKSHFDGYANPEKALAGIQSKCAQIYASTALDRTMEQIQAKRQAREWRDKVLQDRGLLVARFFESSPISMTAIVETTSRRRVKCAAYSQADEPLVVQQVIVTPPVDEVVMIMRNPSSAHSVQCWAH